jgi:hypothetical protein
MFGLPSTRKEAKEINSLYYFTGNPCCNGHVSKRLTSDKNCMACAPAKMRRRRQNRLLEIRTKERKQYKLNPYRIRFESAKRKANMAQAIPRWADLNKIKEIYKNCPFGYEVDHIIPLRGKTVCGLHVETNLQYLTKTENRRKNNIY